MAIASLKSILRLSLHSDFAANRGSALRSPLDAAGDQSTPAALEEFNVSDLRIVHGGRENTHTHTHIIIRKLCVRVCVSHGQ